MDPGPRTIYRISLFFFENIYLILILVLFYFYFPVTVNQDATVWVAEIRSASCLFQDDDVDSLNHSVQYRSVPIFWFFFQWCARQKWNFEKDTHIPHGFEETRICEISKPQNQKIGTGRYCKTSSPKKSQLWQRVGLYIHASLDARTVLMFVKPTFLWQYCTS